MSQSKDRAAAELFAALYAELAGWCRPLVDDDGTAHEIASEAFTRLWLRWSKIEEPRGLLYVTAANLVRDHWRKEDRQRGAMRRARTEVFLALRDPGTESSVLVRQIVQSMPDRLRTSVLLYYFADLAVRDIAFLTRRKERTIRGDLHAAREHLRAVLGERCEHTD